MPPVQIRDPFLSRQVLTPLIAMNVAVVVDSDFPLLVAEIQSRHMYDALVKEIDLSLWAREPTENECQPQPRLHDGFAQWLRMRQKVARKAHTTPSGPRGDVSEQILDTTTAAVEHRVDTDESFPNSAAAREVKGDAHGREAWHTVNLDNVPVLYKGSSRNDALSAYLVLASSHNLDSVVTKPPYISAMQQRGGRTPNDGTDGEHQSDGSSE
jgi:hypothetical protein